MNYKMISRFLSGILLLEAGFMLPALFLCALDRDKPTAAAFGISIAAVLATAGVLWLFGGRAHHGFYAREGMVCVGASWVVMSLLGCLPFVISGSIPSYIDALFEIVSGFTTTGASILTEVESMARGLLYWRSFSHWLGGMGVLVFLLTIVNGKGDDGYTLHLLRAESPGPTVSKLAPKMRQTAKTLYLLYILLTVLDFIFLMLGGMPWFDSICTAFGTAGTGGFGIKNDSIAGYSPYLQNVCTVFMLLFGVNFSCYFLLATKHVREVLEDEELRLYFGIVAGSILLITVDLRGVYATLAETLRHAAFQVATVITTTGFATTDFDLWPSFSKTILLCLMLVGACAGSTGGGLKCIRGLLLFKTLRRNIRQVLYPQKIQVVRINDQTMSEKVLNNTTAYLTAYVFIIIASFLVVSLDGFSITTNLSAVIACFNNIGPGFEMVGPTGNYSQFSLLSKLVLIVDMLAGRLEIFPILIMFSRSTWRRR